MNTPIARHVTEGTPYGDWCVAAVGGSGRGGEGRGGLGGGGGLRGRGASFGFDDRPPPPRTPTSGQRESLNI